MTNYIKAKIYNTQQNNKCSFREDKNEMFNHMISEYCKLVQKEYKTRRDWVLHYVRGWWRCCKYQIPDSVVVHAGRSENLGEFFKTRKGIPLGWQVKEYSRSESIQGRTVFDRERCIGGRVCVWAKETNPTINPGNQESFNIPNWSIRRDPREIPVSPSSPPLSLFLSLYIYIFCFKCHSYFD